MANAYDIALSVVGKSIDIETNGFKAIDKVVLGANRGTLYQCVDLPNYIAYELGYQSWSGEPNSSYTGNGEDMWQTVNKNNADVFPFDASKLQVGDFVTLRPNHIYVYGGGTYPNVTVIEQNVNAQSWVTEDTWNRAANGEVPTYIIRFKNQTSSDGTSNPSGDNDNSSSESYTRTSNYKAFEIVCDEVQIGGRTFYKCNIVYGEAQNTQIAVWLNDGSTATVDRTCVKERPDLNKDVTVKDEEAERLARLQSQLDEANSKIKELEDRPSTVVNVDPNPPTTDLDFGTPNREYLDDGTFIEDGIRYKASGEVLNGYAMLNGERRYYKDGVISKEQEKLANKAREAQKEMHKKETKGGFVSGIVDFFSKMF